jgi:hypothetical protein
VALLALAPAAACSGPAPADSCPNDLPASCPSPAPSWSKDVQGIVQTHCAVCHSPTGADPTRPFTDYAEVYADRLTVLSWVYSCQMPPPDGGVAAPVGDTRAHLLGWLVCGAPDN